MSMVRPDSVPFRASGLVLVFVFRCYLPNTARRRVVIHSVSVLAFLLLISFSTHVSSYVEG